MPQVHPSSIISGDVRMAPEVSIGPGCVLDGETGPVMLGAGTRLIGNVYLTGPLTLGPANVLYPFVTLGFAPQDLKWDDRKAGAGLRVGEGNRFREGVTVHRATSETAPTTIGDRNYFMAYSHAGHDCRIGNDCIFANGTLMAGHVRVDDRVVTGGTATVHQYCRVGRGAMLSGSMGMSRDLPPYFMLTGNNTAGSLNVIGLRRSGLKAEAIEEVRWVYKTLYRRGLSLRLAIEALRERAERPMIAEYLEFIETSKRGICPGVGSAKRSAAVEAREE